MSQTKVAGNQGHVRAGTQIEMANNKVNLLSSEPSLIQSQNNPHLVSAEQKGSQMTLQKVMDMSNQGNPSSKHQKAKSQHKFSQPALSSFNNSIDRIGPMNINNQSSVGNVVAISNKDKR